MVVLAVCRVIQGHVNWAVVQTFILANLMQATHVSFQNPDRDSARAYVVQRPRYPEQMEFVTTWIVLRTVQRGVKALTWAFGERNIFTVKLFR